MGVSENSGTLKSSIFMVIFIINHPFWGTSIFGNTRMGFIGSMKVSRRLSPQFGSSMMMFAILTCHIKHLLAGMVKLFTASM